MFVGTGISGQGRACVCVFYLFVEMCLEVGFSHTHCSSLCQKPQNGQAVFRNVEEPVFLLISQSCVMFLLVVEKGQLCRRKTHNKRSQTGPSLHILNPPDRPLLEPFINQEKRKIF